MELRATPADTDGATRVSIECAEDRATIKIVDPLTSKSLERTVSLARVHLSARARTLAIAASELVSASWAELELAPEPRVPPIPARARAKRPRAAISTPLPVALEMLVNTRVFFDSRELGIGGGMRLTPWLGDALLVRADVLAEHAEGSRTVGHVSVDSVSTALGLGTSATWPAARVAGTFGFRVGYARIMGTSPVANVQGHVINGAWLGPEIELDVELLPGARFHPVFAYSLGWAIGGVRGEVPGDRNVGAAGLWGALALGVAID